MLALLLSILVYTASAQFSCEETICGWTASEQLQLTQENLALANFSLSQIALSERGFNGSDYSPIKLFSSEKQEAPCSKMKMLIEVDNGKNSTDSKKIIQVIINQNKTSNQSELVSWYALDSSANFTALTSQLALKNLTNSINGVLACRNYSFDGMSVSYNVRQIKAAYVAGSFGKLFYYVKAVIEGTDNSVSLHEYWFVTNKMRLFAHIKLPLTRSALENHPQMNRIKDSTGALGCTNIGSYFFCDLASNCVNNLLNEDSICQNKS